VNEQNFIDINALSPDQRDEILRALVTKRLTTREDLSMWLLFFLGVDLADCTVSRFATSNPLDMVWSIYQFWADKTVEHPLSTFYIAGRASQKTLSCAVLQVLLPLHFGVGVVHFGGTKDQAGRAYEYFKKFVSRPYIRGYLKDEPTQTKTLFNIAGIDEEVEHANASFNVADSEVKIQILPISSMSVQGPHEPVVSLDELSSLTPDKIRAYEDVSGVPISNPVDGHPWVKFGISSRKGKYTVIETEYDRRDKSGVIFKFWTVLENTKACPESIRTNIPLEMYVNVYENVAILQDAYDQLEPLKKSQYEKIQAYKGCYTCPLKALCAGDAAKQTSTCKTLRPITSTIQEFKEAPSLEWFLSQKMSLTPASEGLVLPKFNRENFEKTPREIYNIWTGTDPGREITKEELVVEMIKAGVKRHMGLDHGYSHPASFVVVFQDPADNIYVMKVIKRVGLEPNEVVELVAKLKNIYHLTRCHPDTARPDVNKMLRKVIKVGDDFDKDVDRGITLIRGKISPTVGSTKFFGIKGEVEDLSFELERYHYDTDSAGKITEEVVKELDDAIDALSYDAQNQWGNSAVNIPPADEVKGKEETREQYAEQVKAQMNNWLSSQIREHVVEQKGSAGSTGQSKNSGVVWDF
jgi:hypothetical protein